MRKIFLIAGKSCSGKDTIGTIIKNQIENCNADNRVLLIHFGDLVKFFATKYYNWNGEKDEHGRSLLQNIGTEKIRTNYPDYWAEIVGKFIAATIDDWDYVIIPDLRFDNEYSVLFNLFTNQIITIQVQRFNTDGSEYFNPNMTQEQINHSSELGLEQFNDKYGFSYNCIIYNKSDIKELEDSINILLDKLEII